MRTKTALSYSQPGQFDTYFTLVQRFPLIHIRDQKHLNAAIGVMDGLLSRHLDDGESEYLATLGSLIASYEEKNYPVPKSSDADILRHLLEAKGVRQAELSTKTGIPKSGISEILSGRRRFSRKMIALFSAYFHVSPGSLLNEAVGRDEFR